MTIKTKLGDFEASEKWIADHKVLGLPLEMFAEQELKVKQSVDQYMKDRARRNAERAEYREMSQDERDAFDGK